MAVSGSLSNDAGLMTEFSYTDEGSEVNNFGMLSFHVTSKTFGASGSPDKPDNGIDFSNVRLEVLEP